jgi:chromosome segregation ATPase
MATTEEILRARFHEATAEWEKLEKERAPFRERYDEIARDIAKLQAAQKECVQLFRPIEDRMSELSNERATIARALKGKTGEPGAVD